MASDYFKVAPGVRARHGQSGDYCYYGRPSDLLAAGLAEPDWFAERPKRVKQFRVGGESIHTTMSGGWCEIEVIAVVEPRAPDVNADDGRAKAAWSACAWQPPAPRKSSEKHSASMRAKWQDPAFRERNRLGKERAQQRRYSR